MKKIYFTFKWYFVKIWLPLRIMGACVVLDLIWSIIFPSYILGLLGVFAFYISEFVISGMIIVLCIPNRTWEAMSGIKFCICYLSAYCGSVFGTIATEYPGPLYYDWKSFFEKIQPYLTAGFWSSLTYLIAGAIRYVIAKLPRR